MPRRPCRGRRRDCRAGGTSHGRSARPGRAAARSGPRGGRASPRCGWPAGGRRTRTRPPPWPPVPGPRPPAARAGVIGFHGWSYGSPQDGYRVKVLAGLCCLAAVVAVGLAVGRGPAPAASAGPARLDDAVRRHLHGWLEQRPYRGLGGKVAAERRDGHGKYVTAALPLLAAAVVAVVPVVAASGTARGGRPRARLPRRRWLPWVPG